MAEQKTKKQVEVEVVLPESIRPKPANHFVVSHTDDDFAIDIIYINPLDLHMTSTKGETKVRGEVVARVAITYQNATKLRDKLNEMIQSYEAHKND